MLEPLDAINCEPSASIITRPAVPETMKMSLALGTVRVPSISANCPGVKVSMPPFTEPVTPPTLLYENRAPAVIELVPVFVILQDSPSVSPFDRVLKPSLTARQPTLCRATLDGGM